MGPTRVFENKTPAPKSHALGAVVLPAQNGTLSTLGFDLKKLGDQALGVIVQEAKSNSSGVIFPNLGIFLNLKNDELADVEFLSERDPTFREFFDYQKNSNENGMSWLLGKIVRFLKPKYFLSFEKAPEILELFQNDEKILREFFEGDPTTPVIYLGLGIEEFRIERLSQVKDFAQDKLLFYRVLPGGMYKVELGLYFKHP